MPAKIHLPTALHLTESRQLGVKVLEPANDFAVNDKKMSLQSKAFLGLMPENAVQEGMSPLQYALVVNDVLSGMTDLFLLRMYQRIWGIRLPQ